MEYPELPDFLRRDPAAAPSMTRRFTKDGRIKIKSPTGKHRGPWLPQTLDATGKALLRAERKVARDKKRAALKQKKAR